MTQFWNNQEINVLRRYYPTYTKEELIALFPNRTFKAIQRRASYLSIEKIQRDFMCTPEIRARMSKAHLGIKLSEHHKAALRRRTLNESVFDTLTECSGYWFAFLFSDGNVC